MFYWFVLRFLTFPDRSNQFFLYSIGYFVSTAGAEVRDDNNENCGVVIQQGTSFSAPILAGYAAIVRQYFMDGWYPSGFLHPNDGFTPSGALMKAILVHGGQPLQYISDGATSTKTSWGDDHQGYGRTQLDTVLSFLRNSTLNGLTFFVKGAVDPKSPHYAELSRGESHQYQFTARNVKNLSPIRVSSSKRASPQINFVLTDHSCLHRLLWFPALLSSPLLFLILVILRIHWFNPRTDQ